MSKKNIKNNKKNSTRKNYKIEALEPRLMMDADSDFNPETSSLATLYTDLESAVEAEVLNKTDDVHSAAVFLKDSLDNDISEVSQILSKVKSEVRSNVATAFESAKFDAKNYIDNYNEEHKNDEHFTAITSIKTSKFLEYFGQKLGTSNTVSVTGSKVNVSYNYKDKLEVGELGFGIEYLNSFTSKKQLSVSAKVAFAIDLNDNDNGIPLESDDVVVDSVSIDNISVSVDDLNLKTSFMNLEVEEQAVSGESTKDVEISDNGGSVSSKLDLEFSAKANSFAVFDFNTSGNLKLVRDNQGKISVDFPNVDVNQNFSLKDKFVNNFDLKNLPFLNNFETAFNGLPYGLDKIEDIFGSIDQYWARASLALNGSFDGSDLDFDKLASLFKVICDTKTISFIDQLNIYDAANKGISLWDDSLNDLDTLTLGSKSSPTELTLVIKPVLTHSGKIDLNLFKVEDLDVDATLKVKLKVYSDNGTVKFDGLEFNEFTIKLTKQIAENNLKIGLFSADLEGEVLYEMTIDSSGMHSPKIELECSKFILKSDAAKNVVIKPDVGNCKFNFNVVESVWEFPDDLKQYFALTGETLANNVGIYLNSLRTSLRTLMEDKVQLNILGDSAGNLVANSIANIEKIIHSGTVIRDDGSSENIDGLFKVDAKGNLAANFSSVEMFVTTFNNAWAKAFGISNVCQLKYLGNKTTKGSVDTFVCYDELTSDAEKATFVFDHFELKFALSFGIKKNVNLNFAEALGNRFANVLSYGEVCANGNAGIDFTLDLKFDHKQIDSSTTLNDFWNLKKKEVVTADEEYIESAPLAGYLDGSTTISFIDPKTKIEIGSIDVDNSLFTKKSAQSKGFNLNFENEQIIVTAKQKFDVCAGENQRVYGELRLGSSTLQTTVKPTVAVSGDVSKWTQNLTLSFGSGKNLVIPNNVLSDLLGKNLIESAKTDESAKLKDLLNQYFNLQYSPELAKDLAIDLGMKNSSDTLVIDEGRTIMNTFGLYVVSVEGDATKGFEVRFGCDEKRIQGYGENGFGGGYELDDSGSLTYMRVSGELKNTGVVGNEIGVMLEKYSLDAKKENLVLTDYDFLDLSLIFGSSWKNEYAESEKATAIKDRDDLAAWLSGAPVTRNGSLVDLPKLNNGSQYEVILNEFEDVDKKTKRFSLGIAAIAAVTECYGLEIDPSDSSTFILKKYAIVNNALSVVETKQFALGDEYKVPFTNDKEAKAKALELQDVLKMVVSDAFVVTYKGDDASGYKLTIEVAGSVNNVDALPDVYRSLMSNNFLTISSGKSSVHVDTVTCRDLPSLAQAIKNAIDKDPQKQLNNVVNSVAAQENKIVFAVAKGSTITSSALGLSTSTVVDFEIGSKPVDFDNLKDSSGKVLVIDENSNLIEIVTAINDEINPMVAGQRDSNLPELCYQNKDGQALDHLEFRSSQAFDLSSCGLSRILEKLGFSSKMKAVEYGTSDYRIVGDLLLGADWSKLINFKSDAELKVYANASLEVGKDFTAKSASLKDNVVYFEIDGLYDFIVNGLIYNTTKKCYYRILSAESINKGTLNAPVYKTKLAVSVFAEGEKSDSSKNLDASSKSFRYMGGVVASVGFVDVDLVASGKIGFDAKFILEKTDIDDEKDVQNYHVTPTVTSDNNKFTLDSFIDIGDKISENLGSLEIGLDDEGRLDVKNSTELDAIVTNVLDKFGNFSAEDLFAILDTLVERIRDIVKESNVKIPVINKSVSDLVNVAENICDIVNKLRSDKITSLQGVNDRLNKYLIDYGLLAHTAGTVNSALNPFVIEIVDKKLNFSFNIDKSFKSVHQFSFGNGMGISGNAALDVKGDFWLSLSGQAKIGTGTFDLDLTDSVKFGASVGILGEKLSFNLGLDNINDNALLANLITVGSNSSQSRIEASASLTGSYKFSGKTVSIKELDTKGEVDCTLSVKAYGNLPVSVANFSLGDIVIGKCDNVGGIYAFDSTDVKSNYSISFKNVKDGAYPPFAFDLVKKKGDLKNADGKDRFVIDLSEVYTKIEDLVDGKVGWIEKIKLAITGFNTLFDTLESQLNDGMMSKIKEVPVVGDSLSGGVDFLGALKRKVLEPFSDFVYETSGMTAEMIAQKMNELFDGYFSTTLVAPTATGSDTWVRGSGNTFYRSGTDYAEWYLNIGKGYSFGNGIGFDLGFPGLGLKSNAGVDLNLNWSLNFGFGVSQTKGFYFIFNDGDEVHVSADVKLNGEILGALAGLGLKMKVKDPTTKHVNLAFGVDLNKDTRSVSSVNPKDTGNGVSAYGSTEVNVSSLTLQNMDFFYGADVDFTAEITVGVVSDVSKSKDNPPKFPNLDGDLVFKWDDKKGVTSLAFNDFKLDMGSFIGGVLGPIVSKIQKVVEPLESLIDFLTTPFPVLDDLGIEITPLSLAKQYSKGKFDDGMVYAVKDIIETSKKLSKFSSNTTFAIDLGSMTLIGGKGGGDAKNAIKLLEGNASNTSLDNSLNDYLVKIDDAGNVKKTDLSSVSKNASSALSGAGLNMGDSAWRFVWDNPSDLFKLLLGQDIPLVEYDMPKLTFSFDWSTFIRIYGPLGARLGLSLGADINLGFGYDTLGIRQWIGTDCKDVGCLLNGFYVNDLRDGVDVDELSFHGALTAAAELNAGVSAGVGGGVGINVGFNLYDPNKDGKIRLGEMTQMFKEDGLFGFFDVNGKITAKLYAYVDLLFYTKEWNITGDKTLFEFKNERKAVPVMISKAGDDVVANIGSNAANRISTNGVNKTLADGDEILYLTVNGSRVSDDYGHSETVDGKLIINAEKGNDKIIIEHKLAEDAAANFDIIINGGDGDDIIDLTNLRVADGHYVLITGGAGADNIIGAQGLNIIFGDAYTKDPEIVIDSDSKKITRLVAEANVYAEHSGGDFILGGSKQDIIFGGAGNDQIDGSAGEDYIFGDGGRVEYSDNGKLIIDRTNVGLDGGNDILVGGDDRDVIYGGGGDDRIDGGAGDDEIYGEKGHDRILGGSGKDTISGGEGMDIIFGDRFDGSRNVADPFFALGMLKNTDAFSQEFIGAQFKNGTQITQSEFEIDVKKSNKDGDEIEEHVSTQDSSATCGDDTINGNEGNDLIFGDDGANGSSGGVDIINGGIGNDIINGEGGNDTIKGGVDNDIIYGGAGDDIIDGGAGNDSLYGDQGVNAYDVANTSELTGLSQDKLVFGDNLGLHGKIYENAKSNGDGGNDKITTGPGMDFVDGQGGSDVITVKLMGDDSTNYANITDSGNNGMDSLFVEGTETDDQLLVRMNEDKTLGFVALLPVDKEEEPASDTTPKKQKNSNIERVNIIKSNEEGEATLGINVLNVNANGGNDKIYVDGTVETTNINGGAGNDGFVVGQLYNSARTNTEAAKVQNIDEFNSIETNEESFLSDGVTAGTKLNLDGGSGSDDFVALNNVGTLNMSGGKDDDKFSVYSFRQKEKVGDEYKAFERGAVLIDGGKGNDSLNIRGTDDDDTFVVTKEGMLSDLVAIKAAGVENTQFDAAAGDDMFHVLSNNVDDVTELNGGMGNDTFSMGGLDEDIKNLRSANTDGQNVELTYEIVGGEDADVSRAGQSQKESFTLVDTDVEPAVFILKKEGTDYKIAESPDLFIEKEGSEAVFYVGCAGLKTGESITVEISAPMLSNMDFNRGDRGFIVKSEDPDSVWGTTTRVVLSGNTPVAVHVKALADGLLEEGARKAIAVSSTWSNGSKLLTKSVTSVGVTFAGDNKNSAIASLKKNPFVCTEDFVYNGNNVFKMSSILNKNGGKDVSNDILIYVNGVKTSNKASVGENGLITINGLTATSGDTITISVRTAALRIDDSKVALAYEGATITSVKVDGNAIGTFVSKCNQYYELNGNVITFYNGLTGQPMTMHGVVTVEGVGFDSNYEWENYAGASTAAPIHSSSTGGFLTIEQHSYVLTESMSNDDAVSSDEDADPSNSGTATTPTIDFTSQTYNITYNDAKSIPDGKKVYVKITPTMLLANSRDSQMYSRLSISCADSIVNADGSITIYFDNTIETRSVTVTAVCDDQIDDYGLTTVTEQAKSIEPIDGAVYAYGYGKSMDLDTGNPAMLKYNHVIETGANKPQRAVQFNELNNFDSNKLFRIVDNASNAESNVVEIEFKSPTPQSIALLKSIGFILADDFDWDACLNDAELMNEFLAQFEHKTFKWVVEITKNVGAEDEKIDQTDTVVAAKWLRVESASYSDEKIALVLNETITIPTAKEGETVKNALISRNRDSIFVDEMASVDRLFVNNQKDEKNHLGDNASTLNAFKDKSGVISNEEKNAITANPDIKNKDALLKNLGLAENRVMEFDSNALRFNHSDIGSRGIVAAQMEYGEYNLGTGKDRVDVKKTLYRDDAFRTFTVVNTGDSGNKNLGDNVGSATITSSSYKNGLFCYEITSDNLWEKASYDSSAIYYVDAEIKKLKSDGSNEYETIGIQRREVVGSFSATDGFNIKYDFILAEGEELGDLTFTQAEFDDEIVISKHQSDRENGNSKVVCGGTNVSKNVSAPAEESAATETPVASEEPAAEGDAPAATEETGTAESESSAADTPAETETTGEEGAATADADKPAEPSGYIYSFTMNADDLSQFKNKYAEFGTAKKNADEITEGEGLNKKTRTRDTNAYAFNLYVDATMSDGSVQRRVVNGMTSTTFGIDRDFTWSAGVTIVSVKFAYGYEGDGQLVVNAQSGNDKIDASSSSVTRNDMVAFGGFGDDYITMNKGGIAFGDRGQVKYDNGKVNGVEVGETILGSTDGDSNHNGGIDYTTGIRKNHGDDTENKGPVYRLQTDGVNRDASEIRSMDDSNVDNGIDLINVGGTNSVVIGGDKADVIVIGGDKNVALGDNGRVLYNNAQNDEAVYGDKLGLGMHIVETTSDAVGDVDNIVIAGNKNVAMGGAMGDSIRITGADNVAIGDGGKYTVEAKRLYAESKSDTIGGQDYISTGDGKNAVIGGTDKDTIYTGAGNDAIIGDGGKIVMDTDRNALMMTNAGRNINKDNPDAAYEDGSAGADKIIAGNGDNIVFGGLENDSITTGSGEDVVFGDNAYATFQGNYKVAGEETDTKLPTFQTGNSNEEREIKDQSILSFNFTGDSDKRITSEMEAGVEPAKNWNNISGHLSGTYGNNDNEIVRFDDGTRASAISVSYGGHENHRTTSTDSRINLQGYNHWMNGNDGNTILMNSGLMTTAPNQQCGSLLEVSVDGLAQYYESYYVFVYLDIPDSHSSYEESVRKITLSTEDGKYKKSFYIDDRAGKTFSGSFVQSSNETADAAIEAVKANDPKAVENYVVFRVEKQFATDRIIIKVEDGLNPYNYNGKDLPGIAGLQIKGDLHKQDVAVSTDIDFGGNDVIDSNGGDDIVVGGTGSDVIVTYGDERYSIDDNDVVYGDNAKLLFADRDNNPNTATTLTKAESIAATNLDATYDDAIRTGDGNDVVVGGIGSDAIFSGDVKNDDGTEETAGRFEAVKDNDAEKNTDKVKLDNLEILSFNFTANNSGDEARVAHGVAAGVVVDDDWHDFYRNDRGVLMCDDTKAGWPQNEYEERVNKIANEHEFNTFATVNGVNVDLYGRSVQNYNSLGLSAYTQENVAELDGDTANSKIFNSSLALHSQEEIILKLSGLNNYLADKESGETKGDQKTYDVYVYLGGDNDNSDTYNFVYDIFSDSCGSYQGEHRYVNDWVGHFFDGDYREAKCTDANKARVVAENGVTPRIEMIGNYVVFRGVTGDNFTVHIRNYHIPGTNQWPKNLPVITAVQIVTGKGRFELNEDGNPKTVNGEKVRANVAIGGDHDKDLVFGDDAYLEFDFDIPYGVGENINEFQNRVVSANSMAINHDDAVKVDTRDIIYTGKDRDVVVGGEDADTIKTGAADDVVVGDNANLMMEHNNPIGVFTPSNEITLDDHTIDTSTKEDYLGHDNVTVDTIQRKYDPNWGNQNNGYMGWGPNGWGWYSYNNNNARGSIEGIKEPADAENTGRKDTIVDDEGSNLLIEGQSGTEKLFDPESLQSSEDPNNNENPDVNNEDPNNNENPDVNNEDPNNNENPDVNNDDPNNNENPDVNNEDPNNNVQDPENMREVYAGSMYEETKISIGAGESIKLIITKWDKGDQWYTPNIGLKVDASGNHSLVITWDELGETSSQGQSDNSDPITFTNVAFVDIPNTSNVENEDKIVLVIRSEEAFQFSVYLTNLG